MKSNVSMSAANCACLVRLDGDARVVQVGAQPQALAAAAGQHFAVSDEGREDMREVHQQGAALHLKCARKSRGHGAWFARERVRFCEDRVRLCELTNAGKASAGGVKEVTSLASYLNSG